MYKYYVSCVCVCVCVCVCMHKCVAFICSVFRVYLALCLCVYLYVCMCVYAFMGVCVQTFLSVQCIYISSANRQLIMLP